MTGTVNRREREPFCASGQPSPFPVEKPFPFLSSHEISFPTPVHSQSPSFITNVVTNPIVCPDVDENTDSTLKEGGNVVGGWVQDVSSICKSSPNIVVTRCEVCFDK